MEEIWDIYDEQGMKTGRTMRRGVPAPGDYMLCVHVYLCTPEGRFLMQRRSENKQSHPGEWDVTGGAVLSGEDSLQGAIRETAEELGLSLQKEELFYVGRMKKRSSFVDVFLAKKNFCLEDCVLQAEEVAEVKLVSPQEVLHMEKDERKREPEYMELLKKVIEG